MNTQPIDIIRDHNRRCCATCTHASLVSYSHHDPLLAECHLQPNTYDRGRHPYIVMVANAQYCKRYQTRTTQPVIEYRQKRQMA